MLRRNFFKFISKCAVSFTAIGSGTYSMLKALVPGVLYEPSPKMSVGKPENFPEGATFISDLKLFVLRDGNEFHAISAVCTHLGCTVNYVPLPETKKISIKGKEYNETWEFSCPCHGSKYYFDGTNYAGPAPRPLPSLHIDLSPITGELIVDSSKVVDTNYRLKI